MIQRCRALRGSKSFCFLAVLSTLISSFSYPVLAEPSPTILDPLRQAPSSPAEAPPATTPHSAGEALKSNTLHAAPMLKGGCFKSTRLNTEWQQVPCATPPKRPYRPNTVGSSSGDFLAQVKGTISSATGSFDSVSGVDSETDANAANSFTLQMNTNVFHTDACSGASVPRNCKGWEQFVYSSGENKIFTQYWLIGFGNPCPAGWNEFKEDCWKNAANATDVPAQTISNLASLKVSASVTEGGQDVAFIAVDDALYAEANPDSDLGLANNWTVSEFNIFGDGNSTQANFNPGSKLVVRNQINNSSKEMPTCPLGSFTGETNNLTIKGVCSTIGGSAPAIVFTEDNVPAISKHKSLDAVYYLLSADDMPQPAASAK